MDAAASTTVLGLVSCREMDKQLAKVASANVTCIHQGLLEEVFQFTDFIRLLKFRRVCQNWHARISREGAPFLKQLAIDVDEIDHISVQKRCGTRKGNNLWQFAKDVTAVFLFKSPGQSVYVETVDWIQLLWVLYGEQVEVDKRNCLVNKVIYANLVVGAWFFRFGLFFRAGFSTTMYNCTLVTRVNVFFTGKDPQIQFRAMFDSDARFVVYVHNDSYVLSVQYVEMRSYNPTMVRFAVQNAHRLSICQVEHMTKIAKAFPRQNTLSALVHRLIKKFDPENKDAWTSFVHRNMKSFVSSAHPLVGLLLFHLLGCGSFKCGHATCQSLAQYPGRSRFHALD